MEHIREIKWTDIKDFEGLYQVNINGDIKRIERYIAHPNGGKSLIKEILMSKILSTTNKYVQVNLYKNGKCKTLKVHRLVALSFIPNPENKPYINHIDGNKLNNNISNLEWCTAKENTIHAHKNGLIKTPKGETHCCAKLKEQQVYDIKKMALDGMPQTEIAIHFNVHKGTINDIIKNKNWKHLI